MTVHPNGPREGLRVEVTGKLAALIGGDAFPQPTMVGVRNGTRGYVVAGVRYIALPTMDNAVFSYRRRAA